MDKLNNDNTDDEDQDDNHDVVTSSTNNKAQTLLVQRYVNNYSDIASEFAYHEVKKEPV
jgi:hypothetical protein